MLVLFFAANVSGIGFNVFALTTQRARGLQVSDGFAQAVHHEPSVLVGDANRAVDLMGAHALLARIEQMGGKLEYGANSHGELAFAVVAIVHAAMRLLLAFDLGNLLLI